jgi:hypothetical protein
MMIEKLDVDEFPHGSVTFTEKLNVPGVVGVPET